MTYSNSNIDESVGGNQAVTCIFIGFSRGRGGVVEDSLDEEGLGKGEC